MSTPEPSAEADAAWFAGYQQAVRDIRKRRLATPLDVERLRQAMERVGVTLGDDRRYAAIAREYAALANPTPEDT